MSSSSTKHKQQGVEILVQGTVQGVGFRPFIYNLACRLGITGTVINTGDGVVINATAPVDRLQFFIESINTEAPPLSHISKVEISVLTSPVKYPAFSILPSSSTCSAVTSIPPDVALCKDCLAELRDPDDRRYHYPFINCTNCGPRFTIVRQIPYDRPKTSMQVFAMCKACRKEYLDPTNRRFHAQPNACPDCGPSISLHDVKGGKIETAGQLAEVISLLNRDHILAIRSLGGFHLVVNACSAQAIETLRTRKIRPDKPLAIMVREVEIIKKFCTVSELETSLLKSPSHPIVLLKKKTDTSLAENLAPGIGDLGVMLPYTPLHHLLFETQGCPEALVMTSGNASGAPICTSNTDAQMRLDTIADAFLFHNREIVTRVDDSVVKVVSGQPLLLRRSRGFTPSPIHIPVSLPQIIGCGAGLKSTFSLARKNNVYPSQHLGDLDNLANYDFYLESLQHLSQLLQFEAEAIACDLHPDYLSSQYAAGLSLPLYKVQHHHAHAVAVMAEHGLTDPVLAIVADGTGLGDDGTIWGGEILLSDLTSYKRLGHLSHLPLPGGDSAAVEPWRMAVSGLFQAYGSNEAFKLLPKIGLQFDSQRVATLLSMLDSGFNCPNSSSCGRLFDAVAGILGLRQKITYEGQAAMELETLAASYCGNTWRSELNPPNIIDFSSFLAHRDGKWEISCAKFVKLIVDGITSGKSPAEVAWSFHSTLINTLTRLIDILAEQTGIRKIVLSGGCMQNSILLEGLLYALNSIHLNVFTGNLLPVNDGAISFGQTIIGGLRHVYRNSHEGDKRPG